jgi:pimeloyl-ACP methyl ester carboxylesterase
MGGHIDREPFYFDYAYQQGAEDGYQYQGRLVTLDCLQRIYVEKRGAGPALLFIPGYGGDAAYFLNLAQELADEFTTITYDRRGNSRSPRGWVKVTLAEQADDVIKLLDCLGIERTLIMSSSNGGAIALQAMLRHHARLRGAVLHEPYWSPAFLPDAALVGSSIAAKTRIIQHRRERDCGELEARLRCLAGDAAVEHFSAETRRRLTENAETGAIEREVFSRWVPCEEEWRMLARMAPALLLGAASLACFADAVHHVEKSLGTSAVGVPGGHSGYVDHAEEMAAILRPILRQALLRNP